MKFGTPQSKDILPSIRKDPRIISMIKASSKHALNIQEWTDLKDHGQNEKKQTPISRY